MIDNDRVKAPLTGIFNDGFPPVYDGVTQTVISYIDYLLAHGYPACVVTPSSPDAEEYSYPVFRYFSLPIRSRRPYRYGYPKLDPFIWKKLRKTPFRIVHSHSPFSSGRLAVYVKRKQGVPLIGTFHSKYKSDLKHSFKHAPWCVPIIMKRILNFYNACDEVWIPQASVEETVREYGFKGKLEVVENGIDYSTPLSGDIMSVKEEARRSLGLDPDKINLLFVGQHIWEKGIGIIVDALSLIKDRLPFNMWFIGEGYAKADLERKIRSQGLDDSVFVLGTIFDRDLLQKYYAAADLFLFPSRYDNAPLVVREAAAMGTPAIIPLGSTASEVIGDGTNGFLIEDTPQAYAGKIEEIYNDRSSLLRIGEAARGSLVRGWDDVMSEVVDRYNMLLKRKGLL